MTVSTIISLLHLGLGMFGLTFMLLDNARLRCVPNSHERYVFASAVRVLQWPAMVWPVVGFIDNVLVGAYFFTPISVLLGYFIFARVRDFRKSDDEDFWNKLGKKLKRKVKNGIQKAADALVPQPALKPIPVRS